MDIFDNLYILSVKHKNLIPTGVLLILGMIRKKESLREEDVGSLKLLRPLTRLAELLHADADCPNRIIHHDKLLCLLLLMYFNPVVTSLRDLSELSGLKKVRRKLDIPRFGKSTIAEAMRTLETSPEAYQEQTVMLRPAIRRPVCVALCVLAGWAAALGAEDLTVQSTIDDLLRRGAELYAQSKLQDAQRQFQEVLKLDSENEVAVHYLARINARRGLFKPAIDLIRRLQSLGVSIYRSEDAKRTLNVVIAGILGLEDLRQRADMLIHLRETVQGLPLEIERRIDAHLMGIYAKRPFAIAPYMGENAFIAYTVVKVLGYPWQTALGAIFISGVLFVILTLARARVWMAKAVPDALKYSFAAGIGLFLTFIGLMDSGIVTMGTPGAPVKIGDLGQPTVLLAIFGTLLMAALMVMRIRAFIIIGILSVTFLAYIFRLQKPPETFVSLPPSLGPIFLKLDILGALKWGFFPVILTVFVMDFVDTMGTLIGLAARAGMLDERGNLPEIEKPMLVDAGATVLGALLGTTTSGTYIESAAGIEAGGRTGLTSVVTAGLFLLTLFFAPLFTSIPR